MNIGTLPSTHARLRPKQPAFVFEDHRVDYAELNARINRLANALVGLGVEKGDKVATVLVNCAELYETYWAAAKIGAVVVPMTALVQREGLANLVDDSDSVAIITSDDRVDEVDSIRKAVPKVRHFITTGVARGDWYAYSEITRASSESEPPVVAIDRDDPYNIIYSSGTTGLPKGIVHSHAIRGAYCSLFASAFRMTPESVVLHSGSIVFNGSFLTLMPAMFLGTKYVLESHYEPERFIETVAREKVTHVMMVPSTIVALLRSPDFDAEKLASLEMILSVGAPLHKEHKDELNERLPGVFYELYGLTEGFVTVLDKHDAKRKSGSVGSPPPFFEMRIVDDQMSDVPPGEVGEIAGRGPILMSGYYKRPDLTERAIRDGWLLSGDLGYVDDEGYLFLVDRKKDMIISGGVNVYPKDIEEIVVQHPAVRETAVFGIPSDKWGETPVAAIVPNPDTAVTPTELRDWVNGRVGAKFQRLHDVIVKDDFPRNAAGKTLKRVMRDEYCQARA